MRADEKCDARQGALVRASSNVHCVRIQHKVKSERRKAKTSTVLCNCPWFSCLWERDFLSFPFLSHFISSHLISMGSLVSKPSEEPFILEHERVPKDPSILSIHVRLSLSLSTDRMAAKDMLLVHWGWLFRCACVLLGLSWACIETTRASVWKWIRYNASTFLCKALRHTE